MCGWIELSWDRIGCAESFKLVVPVYDNASAGNQQQQAVMAVCSMCLLPCCPSL